MKAMRPQCFLSVFMVLLFASAAFGDGCYIPERAVRKIPKIPAQRAVLSWKDGVETLVISSALDSEAQKLGWIIPLPSVPKTLEKESPGGLKTLDFCIQPDITHDLSQGLKASIYAVFIANLLMATFLFKRKSFVSVTVFVFIFFVLLPALLLPASAGARGATQAANVQVEKTVVVGSYDISVLRSSKPDELNAWLGENGFSSLPEEADKTIADYISKGWVFAAIQLTRTESGSNAPHPIKMVFESEEAVYPLKLTAVAGGSPQFEIFAIGDGTASCKLLEETFCDKFSRIDRDAEDAKDGYETKMYYSGTTSDLRIGHPAICSLMWDGCVLTKYAGTMRSEDMTCDMRFIWKPFMPFRQHFYTLRGARTSAEIIFVLLAGGWSFFSMIACYKRIMQPRGLMWYIAKVILPAFLVFAVGAVVLFSCLPQLSASEVQTSRGFRGWYNSQYDLRNDIDSLLKDRQDILQGTEGEIADYLLKALPEYRGSDQEQIETITGAELHEEDSPGNFTVEKLQDKVLIRVYDRIGMVLVTEYPISAG